jgi:hypothetical protein
MSADTVSLQLIFRPQSHSHILMICHFAGAHSPAHRSHKHTLTNATDARRQN